MRIAHLSDLHLMRGPLAPLPAAGLADALGRALAIEPQPDCVVITGDLADTGHPDEYAALRYILRRCPVPVHLMPGNHDDPAALIARFGDTPFLGNGVSPSYTVEYPQATIVIANSWVQDSPAGCLGPDQLAWIDRVLGARPGVPAFVCLHHPPVPVGIPFLDGMILDDAAALADVITRHSHVVRVLAGHVHRDVSALFAGTLMTVAPSTFRQSALRLHDAGPPGYVAEPTGFLLHVLDGSTCVTHSVAASHAAAVRAFLSLELLAAHVDLAAGHQSGQRLVQGIERAVPGRVPGHLPGPVDARGDAAGSVLAGDLRLFGAGLALEPGPVGELERRLAAEPRG